MFCVLTKRMKFKSKENIYLQNLIQFHYKILEKAYVVIYLWFIFVYY